MNATATATQSAQFVNWNGRKAPTCACGKRAYCDNSCNTFGKRERSAAAELADLGMGMSFDDWKELYGGAR